jgi:hypothetical protein
VSLLEVAIALLILAVALVPMIDLFSAAGRQVRQTGDYGQALILAEKVADELRLASWENVHIADVLDAGDGQSVREPVVDGRSPFFAAIEDLAIPLGRIRRGEDPPISRTTGPLYDQLRSFKLGIRSRSRQAPVTGQVVDVVVEAEWRDFQQARRTLEVELSIGRFGARDARPEEVDERGRADAKIREMLYPDRNAATLEDAVRDGGGNPELVRALGDASLVVNGLIASEALYRADAALLAASVARNNVPQDRARAQIALARLHERRGSVLLQAAVALAGPVEILGNRYDPPRLGLMGVPAQTVRAPMVRLFTLGSELGAKLAEARRAYTQAYNAPLGASLPPRLRIRTFVKILEIHKLEVLAFGPPNVGVLRSAIQDFADYHEGRNSNFARFARSELARCADMETLQRAYPVPGRLAALTTFCRASTVAAGKVLGAPWKPATPGGRLQ